MKQDMNLDLGLESFLEPDSDFIEELCEHLEIEGIHLTNELKFLTYLLAHLCFFFPMNILSSSIPLFLPQTGIWTPLPPSS